MADEPKADDGTALYALEMAKKEMQRAIEELDAHPELKDDPELMSQLREQILEGREKFNYLKATLEEHHLNIKFSKESD